MKKKILILLLSFISVFSLMSCTKEEKNDDIKIDDVIVLFTNDVHCGIDDNIGYAGLSQYKKDLEEKYDHVVLVDSGDFVQGSYEGTVSKGEYIIDIMNEVGYDFCIFGNHEFDYGMEQLKKNVEKSNAQFLNCNISYTGSSDNWIKDETKPYVVKEYGKIKVGFIGVSTPDSISSSTPVRFMEDGEFVYDFSASTKDEFYNKIQENVDKCYEEDADYVVVLSHLGVEASSELAYTSIELVENTKGIDVVLDAHSHTEASCWVYQNKDGEDVFISSTGTKLSKIGKLVLTESGIVSVGYIDSYTKKDETITNKIASIRELFNEEMNKVVGHIDEDLLLSDLDGIRMVRSREIPIGDFVADAYRIVGGADIGMCNGGGIRADLLKGDITYQELIAVNPFGNTLCVCKVKGSEILDMLEYFYRYVETDYKKDGRAYGEDGSFQQVSGLKFTVDTSIEPSVIVDENDSLTGIGNTRRVKDVMVLEGDTYVPINLDKTYTLASHNYMIKNGGSGMLMFLSNHELVIDESISDYQILIDYMNMLNGDLSKYKTSDNRITIR